MRREASSSFAPVVFGVVAGLSASSGCRHRESPAGSQSAADRSQSAVGPVDGSFAALHVADAAVDARSSASAPDAALRAAADAVIDAGEPARDAGPPLIDVSMGIFSFGSGTRSAGFGPRRHGPIVDTDSPTISGAFESFYVRAVPIHGHRYFLACYERALAHSPGLRGRAVVRFVIGPTGGVTNASVTETSLADPSLASCVAGIFLRTRFAAQEGREPVVVSFPFVFEPPAP